MLEKIFMKGDEKMTNDEWEYRNQDGLKRLYDETLAGKRPKSKIRKFKCPWCGRDFYTLVDSKKYCLWWTCGKRYTQAKKRLNRLWDRADRKCQTCGKTFTPDRSDAVYCCNACRQKAYRQRASATEEAKCTK